MFLNSVLTQYGVNSDWLESGEGEMFLPEPGRVHEAGQPYNKHGGWKPHEEMKAEEYQLLGMAFAVLQSDTEYQSALAANIRAFHSAVEMKKDLNRYKKQLTDQTQKLIDVEKRLRRLEGVSTEKH